MQPALTSDRPVLLSFTCGLRKRTGTWTKAEKESAKARKSLLEATRKSLELELQLTTRQGERDLAAGTDAAASLRQDNVVRELERKVLEAQRTQADREKQLADRQVDITKRRLELYQAQQAAVGGR